MGSAVKVQEYVQKEPSFRVNFLLAGGAIMTALYSREQYQYVSSIAWDIGAISYTSESLD